MLFRWLGGDILSAWGSVFSRLASVTIAFVINSAALTALIRLLTGTSLPWARILPGAALGAGAAAGAAVLLERLVAGVRSTEPLTMAGMAAVLVAATLERLPPSEAHRLLAGLGTEDAGTVERLQGLITGSGSVDWVETRIGDLLADALEALAEAHLGEEGYAALADLARQATQRAA